MERRGSPATVLRGSRGAAGMQYVGSLTAVALVVGLALTFVTRAEPEATEEARDTVCRVLAMADAEQCAPTTGVG